MSLFDIVEKIGMLRVENLKKFMNHEKKCPPEMFPN